jgi:DNA-binding GntR family transcriptional regulator
MSVADAMTDEVVVAQISAARVASRRVTAEHLEALRDSVERACRLPATVPWERRAAAHAEFFDVLADVFGDSVVAPVLSDGAKLDYDLMAAAGCQAEGMIVGSRRRFLAHLRTGDADAAALEMEKHLCVLYYMWQLAGDAQAAV